MAGLLLLALWPAASGVDTPPAGRAAQTTGIHEIQHVIVIMQENRSFDFSQAPRKPLLLPANP